MQGIYNNQGEIKWENVTTPIAHAKTALAETIANAVQMKAATALANAVINKIRLLAGGNFPSGSFEEFTNDRC